MHFMPALPRPARNERGEGWGEGKSNKTKLLSPTLSSSFVGREGEDCFGFVEESGLDDTLPGRRLLRWAARAERLRRIQRRPLHDGQPRALDRRQQVEPLAGGQILRPPVSIPRAARPIRWRQGLHAARCVVSLRVGALGQRYCDHHR